MKLRLERLREHVPGIDPDPRVIARRLTLAGIAVERVLDPEGDPVLELEITTNRPDLLCYVGVARELAALFALPRVTLSPGVLERPELASVTIAVAVEVPEKCPRYSARVIRDITVGPSPSWLRSELEAAGFRSINNVVDITNFVLLELGHPLHGFDLARLSGHRVVVRSARPGERLRTLDGQLRNLDTDDLVIADAERPVALAGVMGGADSEIRDDTRDILLESAWFDPPTIRRMSRRHQLRSEASLRFERGADLEATTLALDRACGLLSELAGGRALTGALDVRHARKSPTGIRLRPARLDAILGIHIPDAETLRILDALGFKPASDGDAITVAVPSFRTDVEREIDLIEEVGRVHGYDGVPATLPPSAAAPRGRTRPQQRLGLVRSLLAGAGWSEAVTLSMVAARRELAFLPETVPVSLANPLSDRMAVLRTSLLGGLVEVIDHNLRHGATSASFYEAARVFGGDGRERLNLGLAVAATGSPIDAALVLKGALALLAHGLRLGDLRVDADNLPANVDCGAKRWGRLLRVSPTQLAACDADPKLVILCAEVNLDAAVSHETTPVRYRPFSRVPASTRDISLWSSTANFADVVAVVRGAAGPLLEDLRFLDRYPDRASSRVSLTLRLTYRDPQRTLEADEVQRAHDQVLAALAADPRLALRI